MLSVAIVTHPFGDSGGPEVAELNLAEALVNEGVNVTIFAPSDWRISINHVPSLQKSIWNMTKGEKRDIASLRLESQMSVLDHANEFDVVHFNCQRYSHFAASKIKVPTVLTMHNKFSDEEFIEAKKAGMHVVALTKAQARDRMVDAIINHGIPTKKISPSFEKGDYLLFVGRLAEQKGVDSAIKIAKQSGKKLFIIGRTGNTSERIAYFENYIKPYIDDEQIYYLGTVSHNEIYDYYKKAQALLFPIKYPEAFGLVAVEALACGTPVVGTKTAPLPEILRDEKVAYLSDNIQEIANRLKTIETFDRQKCRKYAEENFDSSVMAKKYLALYEKILQK